MYKQVDQHKRNESQLVVQNTVGQKTGKEKQCFSFMDNRHEAVAQRKQQAMAEKYSSQQQEPIQKNENEAGLLNSLKPSIKNLSSNSVDDIKVHYSSDRPAPLQALAYAQGTDTHVVPGQQQPLPHEAWHEVQQEQRHVQPTMQMKDGLAVNGDKGSESKSVQKNTFPSLNKLVCTSIAQLKNAENLQLSDFLTFSFSPTALTDDQKKAEIRKSLDEEPRNTSQNNSHPETAEFIRMMKVAQFSDDEANAIWDSILNGRETQKKCNDNAAIKKDSKNTALFIGHPNNDPIYTSDNDRIRNANVDYIKAANLVKEKLSIKSSGKKLALWTGGYDLSTYASKRGFTTLEESDFGKILDKFYISSDWKLIGPLWNIISGVFVKKYIDDGGNELHVFIRAYDPASVLVRQEIDQIYSMASSTEIKINWHCIVSENDISGQKNVNDKYYEIRENGSLGSEDADFSTKSETECLTRMLLFYEKNKKTDKSEFYSHEVMKKRFAKELNSDFDQIREHIKTQKYIERIRVMAYQIWEGNGSHKNQAKKQQEKEYYGAKEIVISELIDEKAKQNAYFKWEKNGCPQNQTKEQKDKDYFDAKNEFLKAVEGRAYKIWQERINKDGNYHNPKRDYYDATLEIALGV